ncbi:putative NAD/FAD-dependent oxidoreductase [Streptomyces sp. PVA_94-07]|nr:putative NAD/FAD-dependent oxidoreductase [Streptomyces sp. PVA_94-07]
MAPADVRGGLAAGAGGAGRAAPDALVAVDPLVGDGGDLGGVAEQAGDEGAADLGELVLGAGLVEGVAVALEEGEVGVHAGTRVLREGLGHEGRLHALFQRDLLHDEAEGHDVVRGGERVGVAEVDLLLAGGALVVAELDGDAHRLEHGDRLAAEVHADVLRGVVEVAGAVGGDRAGAVHRLVLQQEELDLRVGVEGEAQVGGLGQGALEDVARVGEGRGAVGHEDVAEHAGGAGGLRAPRQHLEGGGVGLGDHVGLVDAGEALDGGAVEADALVERLLQLGRGHGNRLEEAEDVGEPQAHEPDVALLQRTKHELLLLVHSYILAVQTACAPPPSVWVPHQYHGQGFRPDYGQRYGPGHPAPHYDQRARPPQDRAKDTPWVRPGTPPGPRRTAVLVSSACARASRPASAVTACSS